MSDLIAERAVLLRQVAELQSEVARLQAAMAVPDEVPDQDWASLDGAVAWHLIDRHAEGWADIGRQMDLWLAARSAAALAALQSEVEALRADAERYRWLRQFFDIDDVGDERSVYALVIRHETLEEAAWRARMWSISEYMDGEPTVEDAIDAARKEG